MGTVMDATWENPNTVIMVGPTEWTDSDSVQMEMWKYSVGDRKLQKFIYPDKIHAAWHKYTQQWMEKISDQNHPRFLNPHNIQIGIKSIRATAV
jgi:hypothetical protein